MIEWVVGVLTSTALLTFCGRTVYWKGYRRGAREVLNDWKQYMIDTEELDNDSTSTNSNRSRESSN